MSNYALMDWISCKNAPTIPAFVNGLDCSTTRFLVVMAIMVAVIGLTLFWFGAVRIEK